MPIENWPKAPSLTDLQQDFQAAQIEQAKFLTKINQWRTTLKAEKKPADGKRSTTQPKLARKTLEWQHPGLVEPFLEAPKIFTVAPRTWEDVDGAKQNELLLNYQMDVHIGRFDFIESLVRTMEEDGTVIVLTGWKRTFQTGEIESPIFEYRATSNPEILASIAAAVQLRDESPAQFLDLPIELQQAVQITEEMGYPVEWQQNGTVITKGKVIKDDHPFARVLEIGNVFPDPSCEGDITRARYVVYSFETSKAELQEEGGYENLDAIQFQIASPGTVPNHQSITPIGFQFKDKSRQRGVAYRYWGYYDVEGNGELTPIVATWVGSTLIQLERSPFEDGCLPFTVIRKNPAIKSLYGEPDAELLEDNQNIQGALVRGTVDVMANSANSQVGIPKGLLDPINEHRFANGENYQYNPNALGGMGATAILHHTYPELPASVFNLIQQQTAEAETMTGVSLQGANQGSGQLGDVTYDLTPAAKREMNTIRRISNGLEKIGEKLLKLNYQFLTREQIIRITNTEFVSINKESLKGNFDMKVKISSAAADQAKANRLTFMLQTMGNTAAPGLVKRLLSEVSTLWGLDQLSHDILTYEEPPSEFDQRRQQLELAKMEADIAEQQAEAQLRQARAAYYVLAARRLGAQADQLELDTIEQETGTKHARDVDRISAQARSQAQSGIVSALLDQNNIDAAIGYTQVTQ